MRDFWRGEPSTLGEFASRLTGSSDLYEHSGRKPIASINFVTAHDGFTLRDLVSYNDKHNEANGEDGNDGESHNRSWNCGVEGPTDDPEVNALRLRQQRNFLTTLLLLSQGVPMIAARRRDRPHPAGQQQRLLPGQRALLGRLGPRRRRRSDLYAFTPPLVELRREHPVFRRRRFFAGSADHGGQSELGDIAWFQPCGEPMDETAWADGEARSLMVFLNGQAIPDARLARPPHRSTTTSSSSSTRHHEALPFILPGEE